MKTHFATFPSQPTVFAPQASQRSPRKNWRLGAIGIARIAFGLVWACAAWLKWQPEFQKHYLDQVAAAKAGQSSFIQGWISLWMHIVSLNPLIFAHIEASMETMVAFCLILGVFSNLTYSVGFLLSLGIWSTAEGFGGPYKMGQSTDIGTALPYAIVFVLLFCVSAGYYYGLDRWLAPRLGRLSFLALCTCQDQDTEISVSHGNTMSLASGSGTENCDPMPY